MSVVAVKAVADAGLVRTGNLQLRLPHLLRDARVCMVATAIYQAA